MFFKWQPECECADTDVEDGPPFSMKENQPMAKKAAASKPMKSGSAKKPTASATRTNKSVAKKKAR
jgi:hypothetical protein